MKLITAYAAILDTSINLAEIVAVVEWRKAARAKSVGLGYAFIDEDVPHVKLPGMLHPL